MSDKDIKEDLQRAIEFFDSNEEMAAAILSTIIRPLRRIARKEHKAEIAKAIAEAEEKLAEELANPEGEYYTGLRCGVEDRDITDRYEAVEYGWDQAFSYIGSILGAPHAG